MSEPRPIRACIVVAYDMAEEGGVKRNAMHVAAALGRLGDEVTVIGPARRAARALLTGTVSQGAGVAGGGVELRGFGGVVNIRGNGSDNRLGLFASPLAVRRFFRSRRFDVVHVHEPLLPALPWWAVWSSRSAAHVCTFHGYDEGEGRAMRLLRRAAGAALLRRFERGIAVSGPAESFARVAWRRPLALIPNGVPTRLYRPADGGSGGLGRDGTDAERPVRLLFVGHFRDRRKGLSYLLDAYGALRGQGVAVTLDVVGQGDPTSLPDLPGVTYHGPVSSEEVLVGHYQRADVFVSPATGQESFGIVLLEAMATGTAVVCSDIDGYRQVVGTDGARFAAPADVPALTRALAEVVRDPAARARMGEANRTRSERFDWDRLAVDVREQYLEAIAERRGCKRPADSRDAGEYAEGAVP